MEKSIITRIYSWLLIGSVWLCSFTALPLFAQDINQWMNMGFEQLNKDGKPVGWDLDAKILLTHDCQSQLDSTIKHSGKYAAKIVLNDNLRGFGATIMRLPITFKAKQIKLEGYMKREGLDRHSVGALFLCLVTRGEGKQFDNMSSKKLNGTMDWTHYEVSLNIPPDAIELNLGGVIVGNGKAWFDDLAITVDSNPLPLTQAEITAFINPPPPTQEEIENIKAFANPIESADAGHPLEELKNFGEMVGDAEIVGLGEATHGTSEVFRLKHKLLEYLIKEKGFTVFAMEIGQADAPALNRYIQGDSSGNYKSATKYVLYKVWYCQEVLDMIEWLKAYNKTATKKVKICGFDIQSCYPATVRISEYITKHNLPLQSFIDSFYMTMKMDTTRHMSKAYYTGLLKMATKLQDTLTVVLDTVKDTSKEWVIQNAKLLVNYYTLKQDNYTQFYRDSCMAENINWLYESEKAKIVLWAHNDHISNQPAYMGSSLKARFGSKYRTVGFGIGKGKYRAWDSFRKVSDGKNVIAEAPQGSYSSFLTKVNYDIAYYDLQKMKLSPKLAFWFSYPRTTFCVGTLADAYYYRRYNLKQAFDIFIFSQISSPTNRF